MYSGIEIKQLNFHTSDVNCLKLIQKGQYLISASSDNSVLMWNLTVYKMEY